MKKKLIKLLAIVLTVVLGSVGCSQENKKNTNNKDNIISEYNIQKSDYIHLTMLFPETINPILNKDKSVVYIMNLIYDGLFEIDKDYNVEPRLVEKYSVSSDGKSIKITLNSNAKWHDNNNVTSSDISYTIDLIKKTSDSPYVSLVENIQSINILDSKSFTIKLKENDPFILDKLTFPIVSKKNMSGLSTSEMKEYKNNFVGNGPYKIKKYEDRQYIILERNEDYFGDLSENRKEIYVKMVPDKESQTEMVLALDSDIANITLADLSKFEGKKEFNITKYEGRNYEMVMFNYDNEYLDDVNFRKAQSMEDKKQAEENKANSEELQGIVEDNSTSSKTTSDFTKKEIKEILNKIELKIVVSENNSERIKVAQTIREDLDRIGIKTVINELNNKDLDKALNSKDYDLAIVGYSLPSIPDARDILKACHIKDEKLSTYITSLGNSTSEYETKKIYSQIQKYTVEQGLFISLGILDNFVVSNKRLEGIIHPNDFDIYKGISNLQMNK